MDPKPTVLITTRFFDEGAERWLVDQGFSVRRSGLAYDQIDNAITPDKLRRLLYGTVGWIVGVAEVTRDLLSEFPELKIVARRGVGYNTVDTQAASELGRYVTIAPGGNEPSVADHALAMMLAIAKRLREGHQRLELGNWGALETTELFNKNVGLLGFGRIAQLVAKRAKGFDATVIACDPFANKAVADEMGVELVSFEDLLARSDYLSLHVPLMENTLNIINEQALNRMRRGAILINTSRDGLVDEHALLHALKSGQLAGAGFDVFAGENDPEQRGNAEKLLAMANFIGTAHSAGSSLEGLARTNLIAARCVADVLRGHSPPAQCIVAAPSREG
jgi:D-3-phosphoglycerate dehydrogenase / 2-oxoglutarate reductase